MANIDIKLSAHILVVTSLPQRWIRQESIELTSSNIEFHMNLVTRDTPRTIFHIINPNKNDLHGMRKVLKNGRHCNCSCFIIITRTELLNELLYPWVRMQLSYIINDKITISKLLHDLFPKLTEGKSVLNNKTGEIYRYEHV